APGSSPFSVALQGATLKRSGHSFGLPSAPNPQTSFGSTLSGRLAIQSSGGASRAHGSHAAFCHAGSSSASRPCVPVSGPGQDSARLSPDQPTIGVPGTTTASPALYVGGPSSR